ncbi:chromosome segregation protein SMC [Synechococcus sp. J7-Johnson]|uniref:chromosome segregation protein SMC n=1 Tax=Synechococcus sp. J7-Johnson TaxID=2823737 RepID=UPI0020CC6666|nr:chromosome segregation protein SMC [Synechococcus sp. J7-Johnson]MCP9840947.1 chromosome segregation protein SMC [Synechococcus sp. J7-Johnson]
MVYINQVELAQFKSFGGAMAIRLEPSFTVITGPNGSGKSNILDAVLFCLGLASSRGMRAERLPDLINSATVRQGKAAETVVSVRFDLSDWQPDPAEAGLEAPAEGPWIQTGQKEWTVSRRLRLAPGGTYSSSFSSDGVPCNLQQLQTQLRRLRVDPEGSNVVMQGDVTRIVSMSARDRRGLIDELAGVALFDSRIEQTRAKLDEVQERQERCRIVEQELLGSRQRLERDCAKARTYQELRLRQQLGRLQEQVLAHEQAGGQLEALRRRQQALEAQEQSDRTALATAQEAMEQASSELALLQAEVKALGEDSLLVVQAELAGLETSARELQRQAERQQQQAEALQGQRQGLQRQRQELQRQRLELSADEQHAAALDSAAQACLSAEAAVELSRRRLGEVAGRSGTWLEEQKRRSQRRQELQQAVAPLLAEQQQLTERLRQAEERLMELEAELASGDSADHDQQRRLQELLSEAEAVQDLVDQQQRQAQDLAEALALQQRTRTRLEQEQTQLEREIARIESRRDTLQETRGTGALRLLLEAGLGGLHGPVAQLAEVEERFRLALEVAAGGRLAQVVVDDDRIASTAIELLKSRRAGRLTFLPLNKIRGSGSSSGSGGSAALERGGAGGRSGGGGLVGRAVDLLRFEPVYTEVFRHVFGDTLVFEDLASARRELGRCRAVTLEGELLERSGAMTGGSLQQRSGQLSFGRAGEQDEAEPHRQRLLELGESLVACRRREADLGRQLEQLRPALQEGQQRRAALTAERAAAERALGPQLQRLEQLQQRCSHHQASLESGRQRSQQLERELAPLLLELAGLEVAEAQAQESGDSARWQGLQHDLETADQRLAAAREQRDGLLLAQRERSLSLTRLGDQLEALTLEEARLQQAVVNLAEEHRLRREQECQGQKRRAELEVQQQQLQERFGERRRARDAAEAQLGQQRQAVQQRQWELQRLGEERLSLSEQERALALRLEAMERALPDPLPEISEELRSAGLEALQQELQRLQQRMEALEPVNMLALEELEQLEQRLADLAGRLEVLSSEREELLLRIETVATLRQEAFLEAFHAVDGHFRTIFAGLSEGEGHLQLENEAQPLEGGLTLVAHPKGKTVRRLASMSGGEKSLTALSFLFALQRFRPSPFYALDEVDSFLDGVNVERLAALIASQADQAQFLVVSHRRPMIAAATRTVGVTQARGAHTQVVGMPTAA